MVTTSHGWVGRELAGGRYRVTALLGEGGMGCVYRARDANLDCDAVIKVPRAAMLADPEFVDRFAREVRSLVRLAHPHIVKIIDVGQEEGVPFAVMQFLSGGSLEQYRAGGPGRRPAGATPALADWLESVAEALDYIHKQGYVHRDIKPANILFDDHGNAYVSDFGVAKAVAEREVERQSASLTETGMVLGTRHYMAPEMLLGDRYDGRIDQYALAVTAYEVLSGRLPFDGPTPGAILLKQTSEPPRPLHEVAPSVSREVSAAVAQALASDPARRFPTCLDFARAALRLPPAAGERGAILPEVGRPPVPEREEGERKVSCPSCGKEYALPAQALNRRLRCPKCKNVFTAAAASTAARGPTPPEGARRSPSAETGREVQARVATDRVRSVREAPPTAAAPPEADDWREGPVPTPAAGGRRRTLVMGGVVAVLAVTLGGLLLWRWSAAPPTPQADGRTAATTAPVKSTGPGGEAGLLERAQARARDHEPDAAISLYQEALRLNPDSAAAHVGLAEAYLAKQDYTRALKECGEASRLDPTLAAAHVDRGRAYAAQKDYLGAVDAYNEAVRLQPELAAAYAYRGAAQAARGNADAALKDCDRALSIDPKLAVAYVAQAQARHAKGEDDLAVPSAREAIRLDPKSAWAYLTRGVAYQGKKDHDSALADYAEAVRLDPASAEAYAARASVYAARREYVRAIADYDQALAHNPRDASTYAARATAYLSLPRPDCDRAIADCDQALTIDPKLAEAVLTRGNACTHKGEYDRALADYAQALRLKPDWALAYANQASVYLARKQYTQAVGACTEAVRLDPKLALAYGNRGTAYGELNQHDRAIADFTAALGLDRQDALAYVGRGKAYAATREFDRAIADFTAAIQIDRDDASAFSGRGDAYNQTKEYDHAIEDFTEAIRLSPQDAVLYKARGDVYANRGGIDGGDHDLAVADFKKAVNLDPEYSMAYADLGYVYWLKRDYDRAVSACTEALRINPDNYRARDTRARAYESKGLTKPAEEDRGEMRRISGNKNK
jgi:tetratricopeptide (TPR) repeat protein